MTNAERRGSGFAWVFVSLAATAVAEEVSVTIYNQNFALIKEHRILEIGKGIDTVYIKGVAATIDPTSVFLELNKTVPGLVFGQQSFKYDLLSNETLLGKLVGLPIQVATGTGEALSGVLLAYTASNPEGIVLRTGNNELKSIRYPSLVSITSQMSDSSLVTEPTLSWVVSSQTAQKSDVEISYLVQEVGWLAQYIALLDQDGKAITLSGWASVANRSGKSYDNARIKLVAGDLYYGGEPPLKSVTVYAMRASSRPDLDIMERRPLFEYHLLALKEPITLEQNENKQLSLMLPTTVPVAKSYHYDIEQRNTSVDVQVSFANSKVNSLGFPLPEGKIRVYQRDTDGSREFLGEDNMSHTPTDEDVQIRIGSAFDILGETEIVATTGSKSSDEHEESYKCIIRNHKNEPVIVIATYGPDYYFQVPEIVESSSPFTKHGAKHDFTVDVPANGTAELTFRVRTR